MEFNIDNNDAEIDSRNYLIQARALLLAPDEVLVRAGYNPKDRNEIVISKLLACVDMVKGSGELDFHRDALKELSEVYERSGNEKLAFDYFKKYTVLNDSILNTEKFNSIATLQMQYETDKSEKEIALLKSQREVDRLQAARRLGMNFGLGGALLGILFVAGAFYRQSKKTERINTDLEKSNRELKETQQQLVRSEKMAAFGKMASRMAHEILNPLNFVNNFSELSEELIREMVVSDDQTEIKASAYALLENMERIHHHGVRAERIIQELQERTRAGTTHEYFESDNA